MGEILVQNKCVSCGGAINDSSFNNCPHCGTAIDRGQTTINEKNKNIELCQNCGSPVTFNIEKQQFACDFCQSTFTTKTEKDLDNLTFEADHLIPFQVPEGLAKKHFLEWLIKGENVPLDIFGKITDIRLEQVYIPYMSANITYEGAWGADIGYNRSETYTGFVTKENKDGNKYSEPVTKTRTVVDWKHSSDIFSGTTFKSFIINNELAESVAEFAEKVSHLAFSSEVKPFDDHYTAGTRQLKISSDRVSEVLRSIRTFTEKEAGKKMHSILPGDRNKNAKITKLIYNLTSNYTYVPFWEITYKYESVDYTVIATAVKKDKIEIDGNRPVSQEDSDVEKQMKKNGHNALFASLIFFLSKIFLEPSETGNSAFNILVLIGIGVWIYYAFKRIHFLNTNKNDLLNNLQEFPEYISLLKQYPE